MRLTASYRTRCSLLIQRESRPLSQAEREAVARKGDYLKNRYGDASKR